MSKPSTPINSSEANKTVKEEPLAETKETGSITPPAAADDVETDVNPVKSTTLQEGEKEGNNRNDQFVEELEDPVLEKKGMSAEDEKKENQLELDPETVPQPQQQPEIVDEKESASDVPQQQQQQQQQYEQQHEQAQPDNDDDDITPLEQSIDVKNQDSPPSQDLEAGGDDEAKDADEELVFNPPSAATAKNEQTPLPQPAAETGKKNNGNGEQTTKQRRQSLELSDNGATTSDDEDAISRRSSSQINNNNNNNNNNNSSKSKQDPNSPLSSSARRLSRKSSSFMEETRSSSAKRSNTPHPPRDNDSGKKPVWRPTSKVAEIAGSPNFAKKSVAGAATGTFTDIVAANLVGVDGRTNLPPIKQTYATNLFQQLHTAVHGRPPIGVKTKDGSRSAAVFKKAAVTAGTSTAADSHPYTLIPPAAQNSANNFHIPPALLMPMVSTLNTSVVGNVPRVRSGKPATSVLSLLCVTGNAETDTNPSVSTCLRVVPSHADHRSVAVERVVPALPREGARFVGTFLGEDSTFLSRQFMTYDGVAAYEEDWQVLGDLVAGDFLAAPLTQGLVRSGVILLQSGPQSEAVANAFCDGSQPFLRKMSEVLLRSCNRKEKQKQEALEFERQKRQQDEEVGQQLEKQRQKKQAGSSEEDDENNYGVADGDDDDEDNQSRQKNPLQHSPSKNPAAHKRKRELDDAKKRGPLAAAVAVSQLQQVKVPNFSRSVSHALQLQQASVAMPTATTSTTTANPITSSPRKSGGGVTNIGLGAASSGSVAEFTTIESLIEAYSFDYVSVSALDIAPGALSSDSEANCDDAIFDVASQKKIILTQRKKHVPFRHSAVPIWTLPSDDIPSHQFRPGKTKIVTTTTAATTTNKKKAASNKTAGAATSSTSSPPAPKISEQVEEVDELPGEDDDDDGQPAAGEGAVESPVSPTKRKLINKGTVKHVNCKTAEEISAAVATLMKTKSQVPGCHRMVMFTLRKNPNKSDDKQVQAPAQDDDNNDDEEDQDSNQSPSNDNNNRKQSNGSNASGGSSGNNNANNNSSGNNNNNNNNDNDNSTDQKDNEMRNKKKNKKKRRSSSIPNRDENEYNINNRNAEPFQLTYEPTIIFVFLSSHMRRGRSQLDSAAGTKDPNVLRAIHRDHKELFQCLEHVAKYDGIGKEQCMLQPFEFEGALTNLLSTYAWLRPDCCRTVYLASVKAFSESPDETSNVLADCDRVKRYPVHPRASTSFISQGLPPIELPPLVAKQAAHILGKNIIANSPRHQSPSRIHHLAPSPPKLQGNSSPSSPRAKNANEKTKNPSSQKVGAAPASK